MLLINRYWRTYPPLLQILLFVLMTFTFVSFFIVATSILVPALTGHAAAEYSRVDAKSTAGVIKASLLAQSLLSIGLFVIPPVVFAYLTTPKPLAYLGLRRPGKPVQWLLVIAAMVGTIPLLLTMESVLRQIIPLSGTFKRQQELSDALIEAYLSSHNAGQLVLALFVIAVVPAIGEELFFRGIILRFAAKRSYRIVGPVIFTAIIFALAHPNPIGSIPIFFSGVLLALFYYLTGSLWCGILAHFLNNGIQVFITYLALNGNTYLKNMLDADYLPWWLPVTGLVVFCGAMYGLWQQRTPLHGGWHQDFTPEELRNEDNDRIPPINYN